jgi:hypothetical protein
LNSEVTTITTASGQVRESASAAYFLEDSGDEQKSGPLDGSHLEKRASPKFQPEQRVEGPASQQGETSPNTIARLRTGGGRVDLICGGSKSPRTESNAMETENASPVAGGSGARAGTAGTVATTDADNNNNNAVPDSVIQPIYISGMVESCNFWVFSNQKLMSPLAMRQSVEPARKIRGWSLGKLVRSMNNREGDYMNGGGDMGGRSSSSLGSRFRDLRLSSSVSSASVPGAPAGKGAITAESPKNSPIPVEGSQNISSSISEKEQYILSLHPRSKDSIKREFVTKRQRINEFVRGIQGCFSTPSVLTASFCFGGGLQGEACNMCCRVR